MPTAGSWAWSIPGDTIHARSQVIGLKETSSRQTGIVWVRSQGWKEDGTPIVDYARWVMVRKRDPASPAPEAVVPELPGCVTPDRLVVPAGLRATRIDPGETGQPFFFEDYAVGERIDHVDGMGVMESENRSATRLYHNGARVHFNDHTERQGRLGACIVYGGVVISLARALSFNGLGNCLHILAINGGSHVNPCRAGDTVYAWSEVLETAPPARPQRRRCPAAAAGGDEGPALPRLPAQGRGRPLPAGDPPRSRLLGADPAPGRGGLTG